MASTEAMAMAQWSQQFQTDAPTEDVNKSTDSGQNEAWEKARKALEKAQLSKSVPSNTTTSTTVAATPQMGQEQAYFDPYTYWQPTQQPSMFNYQGFGPINAFGYCPPHYDMYGGFYSNQFGNQQIAQPQLNVGLTGDSNKNNLNEQQQAGVDMMNAPLYQNGFAVPQSQKNKQAPGSGNIKFNLPQQQQQQQQQHQQHQQQHITGNNGSNMYQKPMGMQGGNGHRAKGHQRGGGAQRGGMHHQQAPKWNQPQNKESPTNASTPFSSQSFGAAVPPPSPVRPLVQAAKKEISENSVPMDGSDWPESLREYVNKAFHKCKTDFDKDQVEIILKGKLTKAYTDKTMWTKDWSQEPLPSIHSERILKESQAVFGSSKVNSQQVEPRLPSSPRLSSEQGFVPLSNNNNNNSSSSLNGTSKRLKANSSTGYKKKKGKGFIGSRSRSRSRSRSTSPTLQRSRRHRYTSGSSESGSSSSHSSRELSSSVSRKPSLGSSIVSSVSGRLGTPRDKGRGTSPAFNNSAKKNRNKKGKGSGFQQDGFTLESSLSSREKLQKRAARFLDSPSSPQHGAQRKKHKGIPQSIVFTINNTSAGEDYSEIDWEKLIVIGTSQEIEKPYLRLTTAPDPSTVRPVEVLRKSLTLVKDTWITNQDYHYACDQLKSIRQDLTVQCVRDAFTIQVYETHARIALEKGDHEEFNQCQTQLKALYDETGLSGNRTEFTGYRILYYIFSKNTLELKTLLAQLSVGEKQDPVISHALELLSSWLLSNYHRFFKLYSNAPKMAGYLIDWFVNRERKNALKAMIKSYRPTLSVAYIQSKLAFGTAEDCLAFLDECRVVFSCQKRTEVDCKGSLPALQAL